ncbi:MAG: hypothetical protein LBP35_01195 [Candidatus Ancillula trichonymphae]|nr:hypothetical protein [Candidatus Ancillula trichonymphae]
MKTVKNIFISALAALLVVGFTTVDPRSAYASNTPSVHMEQDIDAGKTTDHFWTENNGKGTKDKGSY